ncbi:MAG: (d)CMP kinase, partial [Planctomycetaceae bacterium]|nr:(d)CMP kinase [Planctomycetaceae bacterium]
MIVTIDGPAGTGKSTTARQLANRLGFEYLDTGAMYRAVAAECLRRSIDPMDTATVGQLAQSLTITFDEGRTFAAGRDVTGELRTAETTQAASLIAQNPDVRSALIDAQRRIADERHIVCEGRDQGTVAFPHAACKFFLTADPEVRALRRQQELASQGTDVPLATLLAEQTARDQRDENREIAPLIPAPDAQIIDTTASDIEEVVTRLEAIVRSKLESA